MDFFAKKNHEYRLNEKKLGKKFAKNLQFQKIVVPLHPETDNGLWCNGNTTDSGPVFLGSNPGSPTEEDRSGDLFLYLYFSLHCALEKIVGMKCSVAPDEIGKSLGSFEKPVG